MTAHAGHAARNFLVCRQARQGITEFCWPAALSQRVVAELVEPTTPRALTAVALTAS
jgi:hypothetical protein